MEQKRRRKKINYTVMVVSDSPDGKIRPLCLEPAVIKVVIGLILVLMLAGGGDLVYHSFALKKVTAHEAVLQQKVDALTGENETLTKDNSELTDKVAILSETINQKVHDEEKEAAEEESKKVPNGFPLAGPAVILQSSETKAEEQDTEKEEAQEQEDEEAEPVIEDSNPIVVFSASPGTKVIATASGTVVSIENDEAYGHILMIDHGNGYKSVYRDPSDPVVQKGAEVEQGQVLFEMQTEGEKFGYQITEKDAYIDPLKLMEVYG